MEQVLIGSSVAVIIKTISRFIDEQVNPVLYVAHLLTGCLLASAARIFVQLASQIW